MNEIKAPPSTACSRLVGISAFFSLFWVKTESRFQAFSPHTQVTQPDGRLSGLTPDEAKILRGLDYDNAWMHLEKLSAFGEKAAGTTQEAAAQAYVFDEFNKMAMDDVWWETFPVEAWVHYGTSVKVASNGNEESRP